LHNEDEAEYDVDVSANLDNTDYLVSRNQMDNLINSLIESFQDLIAIVASLEIIRCGIWNFFRYAVFFFPTLTFVS